MGHAGSSSLTIAAQRIFDGAGMRGPGSVRISEERIESTTFGEAEARASIHLPVDAILAPGFIDIQVNGGGGVLSHDSRRSRLSSGRTGPQQVSQGHASGSRDTRARSPRTRCDQKFWEPRPV